MKLQVAFMMGGHHCEVCEVNTISIMILRFFPKCLFSKSVEERKTFPSALLGEGFRLGLKIKLTQTD